MDTAKYEAIGKALGAELDELAKKYDMSNFSFVGFVGQPGTGHVPLCMHHIVKEQFKDHLHIKLARAIFFKTVDDLKKVGGDVHELTSD